VCWNCGTNQNGTPDPNFVKEPLEIPRDVAEEEPMTRGDMRAHGLQCPKCGSSKIIPKARILDQGQHSDGDLKVVIYGNPEALIFKNRLYGKLTADICGDCGHVELRVENPEELYDHYHEASE
jgi:DNA-directed RNA polymerase subunit RPC12/RpoP